LVLQCIGLGRYKYNIKQTIHCTVHCQWYANKSNIPALRKVLKIMVITRQNSPLRCLANEVGSLNKLLTTRTDCFLPRRAVQ